MSTDRIWSSTWVRWGRCPFQLPCASCRRSISQRRNVDSRSHAPIVIAILCDISHPREGLVTAFFDDLEVADLDPRDSEIGDLKLHHNRRPLINLLLCIQSVRVFPYADKTIGTPPPRTLGKPKWARIRNSRLPANCLIFQTNADLSGAYCTLPVEA